MPFTIGQKRRLMRAYAPVLFLHGSERFVPVSPRAYLERSALWDDLSPGSHLRDRWGHPSTDFDAFPRSPLLGPGQLTVSPDQAGGGVHYLGEEVDGEFPFTRSDAERALFLDFGGWREEDALSDLPVEPGQVPSEPGQVRETTQNRWAFIDRLAASWGPWRPQDPSDPMPPDVAMMEPHRRRFSADVQDFTTLSWALSQLGDATLISMLSKVAGQPDNINLWFFFFNFFYPAHEEKLRWCEFLAVLNNLNKERPEGLTSLEDLNALGDLVGLHSADYAGDWSTVSLIVQARSEWMPTFGGMQQLPDDDAELPPPKYVGFGRRARSMINDEGRYTFDQIMHVTDEFEVVGDRHLKVFVGRGTHNNFATPGQHPPPRGESVLDSACDANGADFPRGQSGDNEALEDFLLALMVLSKTLFAAAGSFFFLIGLIAAALELASSLEDVTEASVGPDSEETPSSEALAQIIAPEETLGGLGLFPESAWQIRDTDLVDGQIWRPPPLGPNNGYQGAWGVICADDPFEARSGMSFPDARAKLIESLAIFLEAQ